MQSAGAGPPQHDQDESFSRAQDIQQPATARIQQGIRYQKRKMQPRELLVVERNSLLDR